MPLKDVEAFQLYTVAQVAELFPNDDARKKKSHVEDVEKLIRAHGCFKRFGEQILLSQGDVRALFRAISVDKLTAIDGSPAPTSDGYAVAVGSRTDPDCQVFLSWAPLGSVSSLVRDVQRFADFRVELLDYAGRTYGEFVALRERLKPCRYFGNWYCRGPNSLETQRVMDELFRAKDEGEDEIDGT